MKRPVFLGLAFFLLTLTSAQSALKMAIIDSGFCPRKMILPKNIIVKDSIDMTHSVKLNCEMSLETLRRQRRFHGHLVLEEFLKYAPKEAQMTIYPLIVFDEKGVQTAQAWKEAIEYIEKEKIELTLTAAGLIDTVVAKKDLPGIWFIPSGRVAPGINSKTKLFPQVLAPRPNIFVIGDFYEGEQILYDQNLIYQKVIDYVFPAGDGLLQGTSRAVAHAMGKAIMDCSLHEKLKTALGLRHCLKLLQKNFTDPISKKIIKTF